MFEQFDLPALVPWVHLVWAAPLVLVLCGWGIARRRHVLTIFGYDRVRTELWLKSLGRRRWRRAIAFAFAIVLLTAAAVQPRCNPEEQQYRTSSRDVAILLDVSRSMLATDLQPSRLERAKDEISRLVDHLQGDRVGLVVFAGDAVIKCPLTRNFTYFKSVLRTIDTTSASAGGTNIGDAIRKATDDLLGLEADESPADAEPGVGDRVMEEELRGRKESFADLLLITDGEDHGSYPVRAAEHAAALNVGLYTIGLGSETGSPIAIQTPDGNVEYVKDRDGNVVQSKLDAKTLIEMTNAAPRGVFLPVGTQHFSLVEFYDQRIAPNTRDEVTEKRVFWTEIFQPFLLAGLVLYVLAVTLPERPKKGQLALESVESTP